MRVLMLCLLLLALAAPGFCQEHFFIDSARKGEEFVIQGQHFRARTYCSGWKPGDRVVFLRGSLIGGSLEVKLSNQDRNETCDLFHTRGPGGAP